MTPSITVDLRDYDFETQAELDKLVRELVPAIRGDYPMVAIHGLVISDRQLKRLRLDRYMHGTPLKQVKEQMVTKVCGWPVTVMGDDEPITCPGCGGLHDEDKPWYA